MLLAVHYRVMEHLGSLESTQEARVALGYRLGQLLRPVYTGDFCRGNSMQFLSRLSCNFKIARVNQVRFSVRFVAAISQGFRTCLKLDATFLRQKLHRVAATKIACVNGPLRFFRALQTSRVLHNSIVHAKA